MASFTTYISIVLLTISGIKCDSIDRGLREGVMLKYLRDMVNQTKADTLNLPANATSIRENITDTFSCENRTYGYYADVDNDCQVFHVCLTTQAASGRNATYRWSFICPKETVFNQEVLTCTYPRDSIKCEDSPNYYDLNMEIGKAPNGTDTNTMGNSDNNQNNTNNMNNNNYNQNNNMNNNNYNQNNNMNNNNYNQNNNNQNYNSNNIQTKTNSNAEMIKVKAHKKQTNRRKQNIIVQNLQKVIEKENMEMDLDALSQIDETLVPVIEITDDENFEIPTEETDEITKKPKLDKKKKVSNNKQDPAKEINSKTETNESNKTNEIHKHPEKDITKFENRKIAVDKKQNVIKDSDTIEKFKDPILQDAKVEIKNVDIQDGMFLPIIEDVKPINVDSLREDPEETRLSMERRKRQDRKFRGSVRYKLNV